MPNPSETFKTAIDTVTSSLGQVDSEVVSSINKMKYNVREEDTEETLSGGLSDSMSLGDIAIKHKVDIEELTKQFLEGVKKEMEEHTKNQKEASEIAMDHLSEDPKYYTKLKKVEGNETEDKSAKKQFTKDLQDDPDFIEFKKRAKYHDRDKEFTFGTPNVTLDDPYIEKRKYSRVGKQENKEATGSGSSGAYSAPLFSGEEPEKIEATEATGSGSVGAYESPAAWAKSTGKKDWRGKSKTQIPGGAFVSVKKKCKTFPYCNQGDIKSLKIYKNESMSEAITNVSKKLNISENTIKAIIEFELENVMKQIKQDIYK